MTRLNYKPLHDALMSGSVDFSLDNLTAASNADDQLSYLSSVLYSLGECSAGCWFATIVEMIFSVQALLVVSVLLCILLNFTRARIKHLAAELEQSERLRAEEHADKVRLLRYNGVQL